MESRPAIAIAAGLLAGCGRPPTWIQATGCVKGTTDPTCPAVFVTQGGPLGALTPGGSSATPGAPGQTPAGGASPAGNPPAPPPLGQGTPVTSSGNSLPVTVTTTSPPGPPIVSGTVPQGPGPAGTPGLMASVTPSPGVLAGPPSVSGTVSPGPAPAGTPGPTLGASVGVTPGASATPAAGIAVTSTSCGLLGLGASPAGFSLLSAVLLPAQTGTLTAAQAACSSYGAAWRVPSEEDLLYLGYSGAFATISGAMGASHTAPITCAVWVDTGNSSGAQAEVFSSPPTSSGTSSAMNLVVVGAGSSVNNLCVAGRLSSSG